MKHMLTGNKPRRNVAPKFYIKNVRTGRTGRNMNLDTAIKKADTMGNYAFVYKMGTCTRPVHIGGYE